MLNRWKLLIVSALFAGGAANAIIPRGSGGTFAGVGLIMPAVNNVSTNWTAAGVPGGIPARATVCATVAAPTGVPATDAGNINTAIGSCTSGQTLMLAAGTTLAITASISNNTLTCSPTCAGLSVGMQLFDGVNGLMNLNVPGITVTAVVSAGTTYTVSYSNYNGSTRSVPSESMMAVMAYQVDQTSTYINLNKGITLRGAGSYNNTFGFWPSVLGFFNGMVPDWTVSTSTTNTFCGATSAVAVQCGIGNPMILMGANGVNQAGWAGIHTGVNITPVGSGTTLSADAAQGDMSITVASTANLSAGVVMLIAENPALGTVTNPIPGNTSIQASSDFLSSSASPATGRVANPDGSGGGTSYAWSLWPNYVTQELKLITGVVGNVVSFDTPLTIALRQSGGHNAQAFWPTACCSATYTPFVQSVGLENLEITRGSSAIQMQFCQGCWIKNVEVAGFTSGSVNIEWSLRSQLTGSYIHSSFNANNDGTEYPLALDAASTENLVDNNIIRMGPKGMVGRATGGGNVIANNDFEAGSYMQSSIGDWWEDQYINCSHYAGSHHCLFEGNTGANCGGDETHGNNVYEMFFRNNCTAIRPNFVDPSNTSLSVSDSAGTAFCGALACGAGTANPPGPRFAAGGMGFNYWFAYVGNYIGLAGVTTTAHGWVYKCNHGGTGNTNSGQQCEWMEGWTGSEWNGSGDPNLNLSAVTPFIFKNGNYDVVNAGIVDNAGGFSQTLPNSMYTTVPPAYFTGASCTYTWPWVKSQTSPFLIPNSCSLGPGQPAAARWANATPFFQP